MVAEIVVPGASSEAEILWALPITKVTAIVYRARYYHPGWAGSWRRTRSGLRAATPTSTATWPTTQSTSPIIAVPDVGRELPISPDFLPHNYVLPCDLLGRLALGP